MRNYLNITNIYLALWCFFNVTFSTSNMMSRPLFVIIALITVYYIVTGYNIYKSNIYIKGLLILLVMFLIYGIELLISDRVYFIQIIQKKVDNSVYLISVFKSLCPIIPFYVMTKKGLLTQKIISNWIPIFLLSTAITFYLTYEQMLIEAAHGKTDFVNNQGYVFASILPLVFLVNKKQWYRFLYAAIIMFFVFMSMKRGAIIIATICFLHFLFKQIKLTNSQKKPYIVISVLIILTISWGLVENLYSNNSFFANRVLSTLEGNSSHRDEIYSFFWNYFNTNFTPIQQIFGGGANFTLSIGENYAHNDWLELLINNGILGIIIYILYWCYALKQYRKKMDFVIKFAFGNALLFAFLKTMFSMSYNSIGCYLALCIGFCMASYDINKSQYSNLSSS